MVINVFICVQVLHTLLQKNHYKQLLLLEVKVSRFQTNHKLPNQNLPKGNEEIITSFKLNFCWTIAGKCIFFIEWLHGWWCWQRITFSKMCIWWQYPQEITASKQKFSPINFSSSSNKKEIPVRATPPPSPEREPLSAVKPTHCSDLVGIM